MQPLTLAEIAAITGGTVEAAYADVQVDTVTLDSRHVAGASLFVALKGGHVDGHDFAGAFFAAGGTAVLAQRAVGGACVIVPDPARALGAVGRDYRARFAIPVVGVTGSVGKTSTRGMIEAVLRTAGPVCSSVGNHNNALGVPLTLLDLTAEDRYAVVEMGMDHAGEMAYLTSLVRPTIAVITNIGTAHIANLGSRAAILAAKLEILEGLSPDGLVVLNGDDDRLAPLVGQLPYTVRTYGVDNPACDVRAEDVDLIDTGSRFAVGPDEYYVSHPGAHHVYNALAAIAVGRACGIPVADLQRGIASFTPIAGRQVIEVVAGVRIIDDCYNAGPDSMRAALDVLSLTSGNGRRIAVLGDMLELGDYAPASHREVGQYAATHADMIITVGEYAALTAEAPQAAGLPTYHVDTRAEAVDRLAREVAPGDTVLIKASRGATFEEITQGLRAVLRLPAHLEGLPYARG